MSYIYIKMSWTYSRWRLIIVVFRFRLCADRHHSFNNVPHKFQTADFAPLAIIIRYNIRIA